MMGSLQMYGQKFIKILAKFNYKLGGRRSYVCRKKKCIAEDLYVPKAMLTMAKVKSTISRLEILIFRVKLHLKCTVFYQKQYIFQNVNFTPI